MPDTGQAVKDLGVAPDDGSCPTCKGTGRIDLSDPGVTEQNPMADAKWPRDLVMQPDRGKARSLGNWMSGK